MKAHRSDGIESVRKTHILNQYLAAMVVVVVVATNSIIGMRKIEIYIYMKAGSERERERQRELKREKSLLDQDENNIIYFLEFIPFLLHHSRSVACSFASAYVILSPADPFSRIHITESLSITIVIFIRIRFEYLEVVFIYATSSLSILGLARSSTNRAIVTMVYTISQPNGILPADSGVELTKTDTPIAHTVWKFI